MRTPTNSTNVRRHCENILIYQIVQMMSICIVFLLLFKCVFLAVCTRGRFGLKCVLTAQWRSLEIASFTWAHLSFSSPAASFFAIISFILYNSPAKYVLDAVSCCFLIESLKKRSDKHYEEIWYPYIIV